MVWPITVVTHDTCTLRTPQLLLKMKVLIIRVMCVHSLLYKLVMLVIVYTITLLLQTTDHTYTC